MAALQQDARPTLRSVILDMSSCTNLDVTSIQGLVDIRNQLDRHASPSPVEWHFAHINSRWTRRALAVAGFGFPTTNHVGHWRPIFSIAAAVDAGFVFISEHEGRGSDKDDEEKAVGKTGESTTVGKKSAVVSGGGSSTAVPRAVDASGRLVPVTSVDRPFFHISVAAAVESALADIKEDWRP
jgi:sodium-independent sulfate anion transporter 11